MQVSIDSARQHAAALTTILQDAKDAQCNTVGSVYAYAGAVAGGIHALAEQLSSPLPQFNEERLFHSSVGHLSALTSHWQSAACMVRVPSVLIPIPSCSATDAQIISGIVFTRSKPRPVDIALLCAWILPRRTRRFPMTRSSRSSTIPSSPRPGSSRCLNPARKTRKAQPPRATSWGMTTSSPCLRMRRR